MAETPDILVRKGKPWFSYTALACALSLTIIGAGFYFSTTTNQTSLDKRLSAREENDKRTGEALTAIATDLRGLRYDVNSALLDRWTGNDMKFLWKDVSLFWSEFQRLNPTIIVPTWPVAKRVIDDATAH